MVNIDADVIIVGGAAGSSKSFSSLMRSLRYIDDPHYNAIYFRRNTTQLNGAGGLWQEAKAMYQPWKPKIQEKDMRITFPSGASIKFSHMEHEKDAISHQGLQYSAIFWDELTQFTESQFTYLLSRLRSKAKMNSFTFGTLNPDPDSFILKWVEWYLDEAGYPDESKSGVIRYFIVIDGSPIFASTREELIEKYPDSCYVFNPRTQQKILVPPKSFTFLPATIFDNPKLIEANPNYLAELKSLPEVEKARLLYGNWYARPQGSGYFQRDWLVQADHLPLGCKTCRAWDKASTEPSDKNRYPDYTAGSPLVAKDKDGFYYLHWGFDPEIKDPDSDVTGKFRKRPGERDNMILKQARKDGVDTHVVFAVDPGAAGKVEYEESAKKLISEGFVVKPDPMPNNTAKINRFSPFSSACQNGLVRVIESSFPNKATLEAFYKELEAFDGERSTSARHDDWADATASAFNYINKAKVIPSFSLGTAATSSQTRYREVMNNTTPSFGDKIKNGGLIG